MWLRKYLQYVLESTYCKYFVSILQSFTGVKVVLIWFAGPDTGKILLMLFFKLHFIIHAAAVTKNKIYDWPNALKLNQSLMTRHETAPKRRCSVLQNVIRHVVVRFLKAPAPSQQPASKQNGWFMSTIWAGHCGVSPSQGPACCYLFKGFWHRRLWWNALCFCGGWAVCIWIFILSAICLLSLASLHIIALTSSHQLWYILGIRALVELSVRLFPTL